MQIIEDCTPREIRSHIADCIEAGLVPFIQSSPGMGKSSLVRSIFREFLLKMIDHRLSTSAPEDLTGLPRFTPEGRATFAPFDIFPLDGDEIPAGFQGWGLFFDEFNSAIKMVQAACYKVILDRMIGQHRLHPHTAIVLAGNKMTDKAITNSLSTAMQSRVIRLVMKLSHDEWLEDVAIAENYDYRIMAYLNYQKGHLMDFDPEQSDEAFCCPRTWEFMNGLVKGKEVNTSKLGLYGGTITPGVALSFVQFCQIFQTLVNIQQVVQAPMAAPVPNDSASKWATIGHLIEHLKDDILTEVSTYVGRLGVEFRILFWRTLVIKKPELRTHPEFARAMIDLNGQIHGTNTLLAA